MSKKTILTEKELQEVADQIMNSENDDNLSDMLEHDEIPEMFSDSGSSYKPSSESDSSVEENPGSDSEHTSDEPVSDLDENVPDNGVNQGSEPENNQDQSDWVEIDGDPEVFEFSEIGGLKVNISEQCTAKDIFELLFDDDLFEKICEWINLRALSVIGNVIPKHSTMNKWKPTNSHEFRNFLALCMLMGNIKMPSIKCYWSRNPLYTHPIFGNIMSRNRFEQILRCLCFTKKDDIKISRLHKIEQVADHVFENIRKVLYPGRNLSLDEALLLWRGRLIFRQYIPNKSAKYGIKLYELCTPDGFILECLVYTGKDTVNNEIGHAQAVVTKLAERYFGKGHTLYLDNYYNSVKLAEFLYENKTHVVGTLRKNRKGNPKVVIDYKLRKGEKTFRKKKNLMVLKWKDKRDVLMITTLHGPGSENITNKRGTEKQKPSVVVDYNRHMSGVDRSDQMLSYYTTPKKTIRWYLKLFFHFVDVCLWNGTYLHNVAKKKKLTYLEFRERLILDYLRVPLLSKKSQVKPSSHYPKKADKRRRCRICSAKKKRTLTYFVCEKCKDKTGQMIGLCVDPCFQEYHEGNQ